MRKMQTKKSGEEKPKLDPPPQIIRLSFRKMPLPPSISKVTKPITNLITEQKYELFINYPKNTISHESNPDLTLFDRISTSG
ncbi:MAG: hypothetical protein PWQ53_573 [Bacteroidota bacterium]|nr:hypothetical protein [Bacteroidota bacterium]MDN5305914.1 hypothetical protein [Bacteroidota bacterium]